MTRDVVELVVVGLLSGGLVGAVGTLVLSRSQARKTDTEARAVDAKLPAEVDSVIVQGAESAVLTMKAALDSATSRIAQLEAEREEDRQRIAELEAKVRRLESKVSTAERALTDARNAGVALREELAEFMREQQKRR